MRGHNSCDLHFSENYWCWTSFHVLISQLCIIFICVRMLMCVLVCVRARARVRVRAQVQVWVWKPEINFGCCPSSATQFVFEIGPLHGLEFAESTRLAGQQVPGVLLSLPWHWHCKHSTTSSYLQGLWGSNSGPHACSANTLYLSLYVIFLLVHIYCGK